MWCGKDIALKTPEAPLKTEATYPPWGTEKILEIVLRETCAIGLGWRYDWNGFDGRQLRDQLNAVRDWAVDALEGKTLEEYREGTEFLKGQQEGA
jgi:hypothetical protein